MVEMELHRPYTRPIRCGLFQVIQDIQYIMILQNLTNKIILTLEN